MVESLKKRCPHDDDVGFGSRWGTVEQAEDQAVTVASPAVAALNKADPAANWKLEASVRAMDACRASVLGESGGRSTGSGDGSCLMYLKLVLSGSRGAVAVGDSYAVLPQDGKAEGRAGARPSLRAGGEGKLMLLTGTARRTAIYARIHPALVRKKLDGGLSHDP